jgi:fatty acid desaturase
VLTKKLKINAIEIATNKTSTTRLIHGGSMTTLLLEKTHPKPNFYSRHRFSAEIKRQVTELHQLDNWHGIYQVTEDWFWMVVAISISLAAWHTLPRIIAGVVYCFVVVAIGARQRGLRVNNHQATHKALAKNGTLNFVLATLFSAWLVLESFTGFDDSHNSRENGHHPNLGTAKDVDHMAVVRTGLYDSVVSREAIKHYLWSIPLNTPKYLLFLLTNRIFNPREKLLERVIRLSYFGVISALMIYMGWGIEFCLYWIVPLLTTANWIGSFIQLAEHYPLMVTAKPVDIYLSRNRILPPYWNFLVSTHQEGYHLIHHLYPKLPMWNMRKAHRILMKDPAYAAVHGQSSMESLMTSLTQV